VRLGGLVCEFGCLAPLPRVGVDAAAAALEGDVAAAGADAGGDTEREAREGDTIGLIARIAGIL